MKLLLVVGFVVLFGWLGSSTNKPSGIAVTQKITTAKDTINFAGQIQPILVKNCSPCHFTGGKMYERMPFDKDTTIMNQQAGILRRIKGEENTLIRSFIGQRSKEWAHSCFVQNLILHLVTLNFCHEEAAVNCCCYSHLFLLSKCAKKATTHRKLGCKR